MAILGHPFYAAGRSQIGDGSFKAVHDLLRAHGVPIVMAGDTHDFEYYRDEATRTISSTAAAAPTLSIGTALDWPDQPALADYAFYPRTDAVSAKLDAETPSWKWPVWWWVRRIRRVAVFGRDAVGGLRLQPRAVLSELRRGARRAIAPARGDRACSASTARCGGETCRSAER